MSPPAEQYRSQGRRGDMRQVTCTGELSDDRLLSGAWCKWRWPRLKDPCHLLHVQSQSIRSQICQSMRHGVPEALAVGAKQRRLHGWISRPSRCMRRLPMHLCQLHDYDAAIALLHGISSFLVRGGTEVVSDSLRRHIKSATAPPLEAMAWMAFALQIRRPATATRGDGPGGVSRGTASFGFKSPVVISRCARDDSAKFLQEKVR